MSVDFDFSKHSKSLFSFKQRPSTSIGDNKYMSNDRLLEQLTVLKINGVSHKSIAENTGIPTSTFYYYVRNNRFPYTARKRIEEYIIKNYREILEDE